MKASQTFFRVPIRLYDRHHEDQEAYEEAVRNNVPYTNIGEYMRGYMRLPISDGMIWKEFLPIDKLFQEIEKPPMVQVLLPEFPEDIFLIDWDMKTFEEKLDEHISKIKDEEAQLKSLKKQNKEAKKLAKNNNQ